MRPTKAEIERENKKALAILGTIGTLLVPGGAFVGLGRKAITSAFKKAGTIGNVKKPDTVGNRLREAVAKYPFYIGNPPVQKAKSTFADRKYDRTLMQAVKQGPSKFFSSGFNPKTGITKGKRTPGGARGGTSKGSQMKYDYDTRMDPEDVFGMSNSMSVYHNKNLIKEVLKENRKAREALRKK